MVAELPTPISAPCRAWHCADGNIAGLQGISAAKTHGPQPN